MFVFRLLSETFSKSPIFRIICPTQTSLVIRLEAKYAFLRNPHLTHFNTFHMTRNTIINVHFFVFHAKIIKFQGLVCSQEFTVFFRHSNAANHFTSKILYKHDFIGAFHVHILLKTRHIQS